MPDHTDHPTVLSSAKEPFLSLQKAFIEEESDQKIPEGNFVTPDGKILGRHKGIIHYTIGQRKGLGLSLGYQAFVLEIHPDTNEVVIGTNEVFINPKAPDRCTGG